MGDWKQDAARSALHFDRTGAFPRNTEIEARADLHLARTRRAAIAGVLPDGHTMSLRVHHTFLKLPEPGFTPRAARSAHRLHPAPLPRPHGAVHRADREVPRLALAPREEGSRGGRLGARRADRLLPRPRHAGARAHRDPRRARSGGTTPSRRRAFEDAFVIRGPAARARRSSTPATRASSGSTAPSAAWSIGDVQVGPAHGRDPARGRPHRLAPPAHDVADVARTCSRRAVAKACLRGRTAPDVSLPRRRPPTLDEESLVLERLAYLSAHEVGHTLGLDAQLGGDDVRLGLGDGLPRAEHPGQARERSTSPTPTRRTSAPTTGSRSAGATRRTRTRRRLDRDRARRVREGHRLSASTATRAGPSTTGAPTRCAGSRRRRPVRRVILDRFGAGAAEARRVGLRPPGALQPRLPLPPLRHPGRAAVRRRPVPDERRRGRRTDARRLGPRRRSSGRRSSCCSRRSSPRTSTSPTAILGGARAAALRHARPAASSSPRRRARSSTR